MKKALFLKSTSSDLDSIRLTEMLGLIHARFSENFTLSDIYHTTDVGEREALRSFKRTIGEFSMQYLLLYRQNKSASMLIDRPTESISHMAVLCGFDSPGN